MSTIKFYYQYCSVPLCKNNTNNTPDKLFIPVPHNENMRKKWMQLAGRDWKKQSTKSTLYFCEDHFDLPNDMENYMQYKIQGYIKKIRMKVGCLPSRFACQPDRKRKAPNTDHSVIIKKHRKILIEEVLKDLTDRENLGCSKDSTQEEEQNIKEDLSSAGNMLLTQDKAVQVHIHHKYRSRGTQYKILKLNTAVSPIIKHELFSPVESQQSSECSSSPEILGIKCDLEKHNILDSTLKKIKQRPRFYIGIPESCYYLVDIIRNQINIPENHILLCLKKIRLNRKFIELGDDFGITWSYARKIFRRTVPVLANSLRSFIITLDECTKKSIKLNMPIAFRQKYYSVSCIIDCFEIEIQKPSKAVDQSLSWSEYKKTYTLKYLISCTPDGLINYISPGYSGRISNVQLVEDCKFLDLIPPKSYILADRGFTHLEPLLLRKDLKLLRPSSVPYGEKLTKQQVRETKQIASIRIHIKRVIRRVRQFAMLKLHSVLHTNLLSVIDDVLIITCALVNLQDSLIQ